MGRDTEPDDEGWAEWIGPKSDLIICEDEVNWAQIKYFCALVEDGNPNYWDVDEAWRRYGGIISPPAMLMVWSMPSPWRPEGVKRQQMFAIEVPVPGKTIVNVSTMSEFLRPVRVGDRLNVQEEIVDISKPKQTRLGVGRFITSLAKYRNQRGELVATNRNVLFRFEPKRG